MFFAFPGYFVYHSNTGEYFIHHKVGLILILLRKEKKNYNLEYVSLLVDIYTSCLKYCSVQFSFTFCMVLSNWLCPILALFQILTYQKNTLFLLQKFLPSLLTCCLSLNFRPLLRTMHFWYCFEAAILGAISKKNCL